MTNLKYRYPKNGKTAEPLAVTFRENRPTKDYSCKISDGNSNSKCHLLTDYEMVALTTPPLPPFIDLLAKTILIIK